MGDPLKCQFPHTKGANETPEGTEMGSFLSPCSPIAKILPPESRGRRCHVIRIIGINISDADLPVVDLYRDSLGRWEQPTFCLADFQYCRRLFHGVIIRRLFFLEGSEGTRGIGRDTWPVPQRESSRI